MREALLDADLILQEPGPARRPGRLSAEDRENLFASLAGMLAGGIPLLRALELAARGMRPGKKSQVLRLSERVRGGAAFHEALVSDPPVFTPVEVHLVRAGELAGALERVLQDLASQIRRERELKTRLIQALAYPAFVLATGGISAFFLLVVVVPRLAAFYEDFGAELPWLTLCVLRAASLAPLTAGILLPASIGCALVWKRMSGGMHPAAERLPFAGAMLRQVRLIRFASLLSTLLAGGISLFQALDLIDGAQPVREAVGRGMMFAESLEKLPWFPEESRALIWTGEESGRLPESLAEIARLERARFEDRRELALKLLEPLMILGTGAVIGFVVIAMMLPVLYLSSAVR